jgi:hypothetical protein
LRRPKLSKEKVKRLMKKKKKMPKGKQLLLHNVHDDSFMIMRCFVAICSVSEISHLM